MRFGALSGQEIAWFHCCYHLSDAGAVFTFGKSKFNDNIPGKFWIRADKVIEVACGDEHTALVAGMNEIPKIILHVNDLKNFFLKKAVGCLHSDPIPADN